ncbi:uncharacterized protein EV154DRAFT_557293, partial [Mucor mucedo]|uniref:uncharacterized protein n=1 Tax=Mucor mucedo TaxID=29922 RepID=UPI002221125D
MGRSITSTYPNSLLIIVKECLDYYSCNVHAGKNAGNMVERLSIRGYINLALDTVSLLDTITATKTSPDDFIELPLTAIHNQNHQLWSPFTLFSQDMVESVPIDTFLRELKIYYSRSTTLPLSHITINNMNFKIAARALLYSLVISSKMYRRIRSEHRRGNHFVLFNASYKSKTCWYIGALLFYFEHNNSSDTQNAQLVFVEVVFLISLTTQTFFNSNNIVLYPSLQNNMASNTTNNITYSANGTPVVQSAQTAASAFIAPPKRRTGDNQRIAVLEGRMDAYERRNRLVGDRIGIIVIHIHIHMSF